MSKQTMRRRKQGISFYTLTERIIKQRLSPHSIPLQCVVCRRELHVGDKVVRKRRKLYHQTCYEATFLDIPDLDPEDEFFLEFGYYPNNSTTVLSTIPVSTIPTS
jgi:hypothetical protein